MSQLTARPLYNKKHVRIDSSTYYIHRHLAVFVILQKKCLFCFAFTQKLNKILIWNKKHNQDKSFVFVFFGFAFEYFWKTAELWRHFRTRVKIFRKTTVYQVSFIRPLLKIIEICKMDMKIDIIARVRMEPKFWLRPEVPISNHLNLDNILRFFDLLNCLFHEWLRIESLHYFHSLFRGSKSIPKCTKQEIFASCIKLGTPKEESKIHKWH